MYRILPLTLLAALAVLPALAQQPPKQPPGSVGGFGFGRGAVSGMLLMNKSVQEDLKLTEDQIKKITEVGEQQKKAMADLQNVEGADRFKKLMELAGTSEKSYSTILKPEQAKRLKQITLQTQGLNTLAFNEELIKELSITAEQREKLQGIQMESFKQTAGLRDSATTREEMMKKTAEITKATQEKLQAVLTAEQKTKWKEMTGEPFKGDLPLGFGAGRRPKN